MGRWEWMEFLQVFGADSTSWRNPPLDFVFRSAVHCLMFPAARLALHISVHVHGWHYQT